MTVRLHCRHAKTKMDVYLEYANLEVAHAMVPRLVEMGFTGVAPSRHPQEPTGAPAAHEALLHRLDRVEQLLQTMHQQVARVLDVPRPSAPGEASTADALLERLDRLEQQLQAREARLLLLIEDVQAQRQVALERETRVRHRLEQVQEQRHGVVEAPPPSPPAAVPRPVPKRPTRPTRQPAAPAIPAPTAPPVAAPGPAAPPLPYPETWERIRLYLEAHGPQRPAQVAAALELPTARDLMRRMAATAGLLRKPAPGLYEIAPTAPGEGASR